MTNWTYHKDNCSIDRDTALDILTSTFQDLRDKWDKYKQNEYNNYQAERIDYVDIGEIAHYIVERIQTQQTNGIDEFFNKVEKILEKGDDFTKEIIVVGLLEGIQNESSWKGNLDFHKDFDKWLKPKTKKAWCKLIGFWDRLDTLKNKKDI